MKQILTAITILIVLLAIGTGGYMTLEHSSLLNALYMTVITITTVGYGETMPLSPMGRIFTIGLILVGVGLVLYLFSKVTEVMVEGSLRKTLGRRTMEKQLSRLNNHYIVCGFGRIGKVICQILHENKRPFVVIEHDPAEVNSLVESGYFVLEGNASDDEVLQHAGIERAKGLIAVASSNADNVYITLSAKGLNPKLFILARSSGEKNAETKLLRAGANKVISPYYIGGCRMAQLLVRPTVIDFIDLAVNAGDLGLRLEELQVTAKSDFVNTTLRDSGIRKDHDLIVVAIKRQLGEMKFNPNVNTEILDGDILVVLGEHSNILDFEKRL